MSLADASVWALLAGLGAYLVLGGADFGAGFWDLTAGGARRGARVRGLVKTAMGPVWEANHVWLIFALVVFWTAFPAAFAAVMETLTIPLFAAAIGIIFRGTAFALRGEARTVAEARMLGAMFAASSVVVPFFFGAAVGAVASGRVPAPPQVGEPFGSWLTPTSMLVGVLAVATGAYLAAVFLAGDAVRLGQRDLAEGFRVRALGAAGVTGAIALAGLLVVRTDAPALFDGLTGGVGLACVIGSAVVGIVTGGLIWTRRYEAARYTSAAAVAAVVAGWAFAQAPALLPGALTIDQAAAGRPTLIAVMVTAGVAAVVLVPALALLFRLTLRGQLRGEFAPITPLDADENGSR